MKIPRPLLLAPALGAMTLILPGCVVPVETVEVPGRTRTVERETVIRQGRVQADYELIYADGYNGRGYYYGPRGTRYFQRGPEVVYYQRRELAPREYWDTNYRRRWDADRAPVTRFSVVLGDGYAGRGYYYGPQGTEYFDNRPGVRFYRTREEVPREYWQP